VVPRASIVGYGVEIREMEEDTNVFAGASVVRHIVPMRVKEVDTSPQLWPFSEASVVRHCVEV
jgi:hypothetical protein